MKAHTHTHTHTLPQHHIDSKEQLHASTAFPLVHNGLLPSRDSSIAVDDDSNNSNNNALYVIEWATQLVRTYEKRKNIERSEADGTKTEAETNSE